MHLMFGGSIEWELLGTSMTYDLDIFNIRGNFYVSVFQLHTKYGYFCLHLLQFFPVAPNNNLLDYISKAGR